MKVKSVKKITMMALAIALVAVIAIGGTLAYLSTSTEVQNNVFTFAENIKARLTEPNWDPKDGENLTPGYEVKKDPMVTNVSDNGVDEYAAIQLTFTNGAGTKLSPADTVRLLNCLNITWNSNWELMDGTRTPLTGVVTTATPQQTYVYKNILTPGQVSDPVFSSVTIKSNISDADYAWLAGIVMTHTDACYTYGVHDGFTYDINGNKIFNDANGNGVQDAGELNALCTITYKHHTDCALFTGTATPAQIAATVKGGTVGGKTCDCTPAEQHVTGCPAITGTLIVPDPFGHTPPAGAISGFQILVQGAAVQANVDGMTAYNAAATTANLKALLPILP